MSKHTPGSWTIRREPSSRGRGFHRTVVRDGFTWPIAEVSTAAGGQVDIAEANARLIAAAPELLEALEEMCAPPENDDEDPTPEENEKWADTMRKARAAIAKARGEA
jgi:hypothetical protein